VALKLKPTWRNDDTAHLTLAPQECMQHLAALV
jgi:hypothetical protein